MYNDELRDKKRKKTRSRLVLIVILSALGCAGLIVLLFFVNLMDVRSVETHTPTALPFEEVQDTIQAVLDSKFLGISRRHNSVIFSPQKIGPVLMRKYPRIESVEISRKNVHDLLIIINERKPTGIWCMPQQSRCFYYDDSGTAFAEIEPSSGALFITVDDYRDREIKLGGDVASLKWRRSIVGAKKMLQFADINAAQILIPHSSYDEFDIVTREGWKIIYSNDTDVSVQTSNLIQFLHDTISMDVRKNLEYVDLTIEDRIYYKEKTT